MDGKKIKVTIIILHYKKTDRTIENVGYLLRQKTDFGLKIILVDNSGHEKNRQRLVENFEKNENVEIIVNSKNLGYTRGKNVAKGHEEGDYVFSVSDDVLFKEEDSMQKIVDYMDSHPDIAILGPKQINDDGTVTMSVRAFPKLYLQIARRTIFRNLSILRSKIAHDEMRHLDYSKIQDVDWLQSSCYITRRDFWERVGGYNEYYFLFMADTEMCFRAWEMGYRVVYFPETKVYQDGLRVSRGGFLDFFRSWTMRQHVLDSLKYRLKHFGKGNPREKYYKSKSKI
jgi:GT2 family glycosyltransferase